MKIYADESSLQSENADMEHAAAIVGTAVHSYRAKPAEQSDEDWLSSLLTHHNVGGAEEASSIIKGIKTYRDSLANLQARVETGKSRSGFIREMVETGAKAAGNINVTQYACKVDEAVTHANTMMRETIYRKDGGIKQSEKLFGNIAEAKIAGDATINYAAADSRYTAAQPRSNELNSADTEVVDTSTGNVVSQQQMKFYATPKETVNAYLKGGYAEQGQTLIAPAEQIPWIQEHYPNIKVSASIDRWSKGCTTEQCKEIQHQAQTDGTIPERSWKDADLTLMTQSILGKSVEAGVLAVGLQATTMLGRRAWNEITGKQNQPFEQDMIDFVEDAAKVGCSAAATSAVVGGVVVAARRNLLGSVLKKTPAGMITLLSSAAIENIKVLGRLGKGEISSDQAIDHAIDNSCALLGSLAAAHSLAIVCPPLAPFSPILTAPLGPIFTEPLKKIVRLIVPPLIKSEVNHYVSIYQGAKKVLGVIDRFVSRTTTTVKSVAKSVCKCFGRLFA